MSSYMIDVLTQGMRIETTGSWGDCSFIHGVIIVLTRVDLIFT